MMRGIFNAFFKQNTYIWGLYEGRPPLAPFVKFYFQTNFSKFFAIALKKFTWRQAQGALYCISGGLQTFLDI